MEQLTGSKLGKEYEKAIYCHFAYVTSMQSTSCNILGCVNHKLEQRSLGVILISIMSRYADDTTLMAEIKSLLMKMKEESEKSVLNLNIQKTKLMVSYPITLWLVKWEKLETVEDFIFLSSRITVDSDCSHEIRRHLLLRRKAVTNLDSMLKSRDISLLT